MSSFGSQMRKRLAELHKAGQDVPRIMMEVAEGATIAAVDTATENTPPNGGAPIAGTGTRGGELAQHWASDSETKPIYSNGSVRTMLANNILYASYVNDGHRVDKHFVPGLVINGGLLEMLPEGTPGNDDGGIMVGVKKTYVEGIYMKQKAVGKYRDVVRMELDKRAREAFK